MVSTHLIKQQDGKLYLTYNGETKRLQEWAQEYKIRRDTLKVRLLLGWEIKKALTTPISKLSDRERIGRDTHPEEYQVWRAVKKRCLNQNSYDWHRYGGRGISICKTWLEDFFVFYEDMGPRPSPNHSIDRINNDGDYEPTNCRWATNLEQQRNRNNNCLITHNGETLCVSEWSEKTGISWHVIKCRFERGWTTQDIFETPVDLKKPHHKERLSAKRVEYLGKSLTLTKWSEELDIPRHVLTCRLSRGWSVSESFSTPKGKYKLNDD